MTTPLPGEDSWGDLLRESRAILVLDMVESVRLMQAHEDTVIRAWMRFVEAARAEVVPLHDGRIVKSLGDGLLLTFGTVHDAIAAALECQALCERLGAPVAERQRFTLRAGVHTARVVIDEVDIYGIGVNLAARLAGLAPPGGLVLSAEARDGVVDGLDAGVVDLGECYVKGVADPVRAYRVQRSGSTKPMPMAEQPDLRPMVVVLPFAVPDRSESLWALGDAVADAVGSRLERCRQMRLIAAASARRFRGRAVDSAGLRQVLGAVYALQGSCQPIGGLVQVRCDFIDLRLDVPVWSGEFTTSLEDLFDTDSQFGLEVASRIASSMADAEVLRSRMLPMPNLDSYSLFVGAVGLLNRQTRRDAQTAKEVLEHLHDRVPRSASPPAMLANWHVMQIVQGWASDAVTQGRQARDKARRALDVDPDNAFAHAVDGLVAVWVAQDFADAGLAYNRAIAANPCEPFAWALKSGLHTYLGEAGPAEAAAETALRLSPLDPVRFYYDAYLANARLCAGRYPEAAQAAERSLRASRGHTPSLRILAISQWLGGQHDEARATVQALLALDPSYTLRTFAARYPGRDSGATRLYLDALRAAGVPD